MHRVYARILCTATVQGPYFKESQPSSFIEPFSHCHPPMSLRPPVISTELSELPTAPEAFHEAMVDIFGRYVMWCRDQALAIHRKRLTNTSAISALPTVERKPYEKLRPGDLVPEQLEALMELQSKAIGDFGTLLMALFTSTGNSLKLGTNHTLRYRLSAEICETTEGTVVREEIVNRGGRKAFMNYWNRWLLNDCKEKSSL